MSVIRASGIARIIDITSGLPINIKPEELVWEAVDGSERQMGPEIAYEAVLEHPVLGVLTWNAWEYPMGALNYTTYDVGPHYIETDFTFHLQHEPEESAASDWYLDDNGNAISEAQLSEMTAADQRRILKTWYLAMFEDPQNETPYAPKDSESDSNYVYPWGGPYNARDELFDHFSGIVPDVLLVEVAEELENQTGIHEWAPGQKHPDHVRASVEALFDQSADPLVGLSEIKARLDDGEKINFTEADALAEMRALRDSIQELRTAIDGLSRSQDEVPGIGHNRPPSHLDVSLEVQLEVEQQLDAVEAELDSNTPDPAVVVRAAHVVKQLWGHFTDILRSTAIKTKERVSDSLAHQITVNAPLWIAIFWEKLLAFGITIIDWLSAVFSLF